MSRTLPFRPFANATQRKQVSDAVSVVTLPSHPVGISVCIDNRGDGDLMVEIGSATPTDTTSFPIPASMSQILYVGKERTIRLKRTTGSASAEAIITAGQGN